MGKSKREFIMEELMEPGFIEIGRKYSWKKPRRAGKAC